MSMSIRRINTGMWWYSLGKYF